MLCNTCKNKSICKHYEYMNNILIDITIQVTNCELYSNNTNRNIPEQRPLYRQPLPSSLEDDEEDEIEDEDERVFIDISDLENSEPHSASIIDIFMNTKGDKKND